MDTASREELNRIVALGADGMTIADKKFLFARRGYLNKSQKAEFKDVIHEMDEAAKAVVQEEA